MSKISIPIVKEFSRALKKGYTYNFKKNHYVIFGVLWGIPVPIVTIGIGIYFSKLSLSFNNILNHINNYPIYLFFLLHPVIFGVVFGAMGTIRDEKERQRVNFENSLLATNVELKEANKRLKELDELKDSFLSMVSHELLTPVTTIRGYVTFLIGRKSGPLTDKQKEALEITEEQAAHLIHLVEELMDLSKIQAGEFEVNLEPVDIKDIVSKVINSLKQSIEEKVITIENKLMEDIPHVLADERRISQVFSNLLGNAIKFTLSGGKIFIYSQEKEDKVEFCIEDTGIGIPKEKISRIFDRFYQVDSTTRRKYGGCGLGLTITKRIIELHNGRIWADSEAGKGSKFCFELERYDKSRKGKELSAV